MLDSLPLHLQKPPEDLLEPKPARNIDRVTQAVHAPRALNRLLSVYDATEKLLPGGYTGGLERFIEDLTLDIADVPGNARRVLAMAQRSLTEPEFKAVFNVFHQAQNFWQTLLSKSRNEAQLNRGEIKRNEHLIFEQAQYQQRLAQLVYSLGLTHEDTSEKRTLELMRTFVNRLASHARTSSLLHNAQGLIDGAFAQAALMRTFQDRGYFILVPDPYDFSDMKHTDMKGVDFVAISETGEIILIDSKGSRRSDEPYVEQRHVSQISSEYIFNNMLENRTSLEGIHPGLDIILRRRLVRSIPLTQVAIESPSRSEVLGIGSFRGIYGDRYMDAITHQLDRIS